MAMTYSDGVAPIVTTYGPGNLHHLAYGTTQPFDDVMGFLTTTNENTTNFLLSFSFGYPSYAFYWDGPGEAFWRVGSSTALEPVGTSWENATGVPLSGEVILGLNVASVAAKALDHGSGRILAFVIPEDLD
ncbi:hypothetical protein FB45DRAFT_803218 [Roridomyces roridus]|uniref:Uncharacterized protein n=1 Tax=Roridomyces roridus TaxID=1738132 RepID=A0AAD7B7Q2_9AGAR|nr:hypothetical protein FB45DRAFT_803218 [Roridomyces roridus]